MSSVSVLGAGSWGSALAFVLEAHAPLLWDYNATRAQQFQDSRETSYLPGLQLPPGVTVIDDLHLAIQRSTYLVLATPSHTIRALAQRLAACKTFGPEHIVINTAKGLEENTSLRMSQVLLEELDVEASRIVSLVGPSHAEEVARRMPTTVVAAGTDETNCKRVQDLFNTETFRVYTNADLVGAELAVSVKNVIAIAAGLCDGLGFGDNSKGALLTRGLAEIARLGLALGADASTFAGLAGLGDLVTTATSRHSRNRNLGEALAQGQSLQEALAASTQVCEGVRTTRAVLDLAKQHQVEMPIAQEVAAILFENKDPRQAIRDLMLRSPKAESWNAPKGVS